MLVENVCCSSLRTAVTIDLRQRTTTGGDLGIHRGMAQEPSASALGMRQHMEEDCERLRWDRGQCSKYKGHGRTSSIAGALNGEASPGGVDIKVTEHVLGGWKSELTPRGGSADSNVINQK